MLNIRKIRVSKINRRQKEEERWLKGRKNTRNIWETTFI